MNPSAKTLEVIQVARDISRLARVPHDSESLCETTDGVPIVVRVNANLPDIFDRARRDGADGIGLYRSEVLFDRSNTFPNEEEQYEAYCEIATLTGKAGVRIRTFDLGVDRLPDDPRHHQRNPSLGLRAIRYSLSDPEQFRTQVRAILRASFGRNVDMVLPMISGVRDVIRARRLVEEERDSLEAGSIAIGHPRLGVMIETPSAVMTVAQIARFVDFFCLGTNDLVQYLLAVDRDDPSVADWYQTLHPAVISAIRSVIHVGTNTEIPVTVCGEMAGSPYYVPLLVGLGARELSMNVNSIATVRSTIAELSTSKCSQLAERVLLAVTAGDAEIVLKRYYEEHWPFIMSMAR